MYSTLIVLDKPRHIRYTFAAINELEQAIPGGFLNFFKYTVKGETGFRVLRDILYAGLKWEDSTLTLSDLGGVLFYHSNGNIEELLGVWKKVFDAMDYDEWTSYKPTNKEQEDITITELFEQVEEIAYGTLKIQPSQLYALTPRELNLMLENYGEIDNYRTGMICATIMNSVGGKKGGGSFQVEDFIKLKGKKHKVMSDEKIKDTLLKAFG
jgi:hypothetical protein